MSNKNQ